MNLSQTLALLRALSRFLARLSLAAAQILALGIIMWLGLRLYPGDRWLAVRLGSYFAPWLLVALLPALAITLLARRRGWTGVVLLLILLLGSRYWPLFDPTPAAIGAERPASELRVMTFNVHYANRRDGDIAHLIAAEQPDLVAFQELSDELGGALLPQLAADYPYQWVDDSWGLSTALISRYPLESQPKPPAAARVQPARLATPAGKIAVWNVHPPTAIDDRGWAVQRRMLAAVAEAVEADQGPVIVLGDFNTTPDAENYALLGKRLTNVHYAVGRGFGFTFPETDLLARLPWYAQPFRVLGPLVRIDHILVSQHFAPLETHAVADGLGSDHRPVVATLRLAATR
ncbi:MAG: endonuclease/exonuclease/phosphatase family protein [Chloroflexota bacterium]